MAQVKGAAKSSSRLTGSTTGQARHVTEARVTPPTIETAALDAAKVDSGSVAENERGGSGKRATRVLRFA